MAMTKGQKRAIKKYYRDHPDFQGPLTPAQENAAYEEDMRERDHPTQKRADRPQDRIRRR